MSSFITGRFYSQEDHKIEWFTTSGDTVFKDEVRQIVGLIKGKCETDSSVLALYDGGHYRDITDKQFNDLWIVKQHSIMYNSRVKQSL